MAGTMKAHMKERFGGKQNLSLNPPLPANLNIELNNTCNQRCDFCYAHGPHSQSTIKPTVMDFDFACSLMKQASELGIGEHEIGFYSEGEVFLYPRFPEIIAYAKKLGFKYTFVTTNGALAKPELMKKVVDAGLDSIRFSVNASDRETYKKIHGVDDFDKVVENITWLSNYKKETGKKISTSVSHVVTKKNNDKKDEITRIFGDLVDEILFIPVITSKNELHNYDKDFTDEYAVYDDTKHGSEYKGCPIPFNTMYIDAEGKMFMCCNTYFTSLRVVNLHENNDMKAAWNSEVLVNYRKALMERKVEGTLCEHCLQIWGGAERLFMD